MNVSETMTLAANGDGTTNGSTNTGVQCYGGLYGITANGTFSGGSTTIQILDAQTTGIWTTAATAITAAGYTTVNLPPGKVRALIATSTAMYVYATRIPV